MNFLAHLDGVRQVGSGKWLALCPSHADKNPSLSIREGERAILLRCWAGCTLQQIVAAVGLSPADLFYDNGQPVDRGAIQRRKRERESRLDWREAAKDLKFESYTKFLESDRVLSKARGLDVSQWSEEELEQAWAAIEGPLRQRVEADRLDAEAFAIRVAGLQNERNIHGRSTENVA